MATEPTNIDRAGTTGGAVDEIYGELMRHGPSVPRSTVDAIVRMYESWRGQSAPPLKEAPLTTAIAAIAGTSFTVDLPGGGSLAVVGLGEMAATEVLKHIAANDMRLMVLAKR